MLKGWLCSHHLSRPMESSCANYVQELEAHNTYKLYRSVLGKKEKGSVCKCVISVIKTVKLLKSDNWGIYRIL